MKVTAIVLSNNSEGIIGPALESVPWADEVLLVDSGITDKTLEVARGICGDRLRVVERPTAAYKADPDGFASQRNFGLDEATRGGANWGAILDTDERYKFPEGYDVRAMLETATKDILSIKMVKPGYTYAKNKFYRLPTKHRFASEVHEWEGEGSVLPPEIPGHVWEQKKERDPQIREIELACLQKAAEKDPSESRYPFFIAQTLKILGRIPEAIAMYVHCGNMEGPCEQRGLAWFFASQCACLNKDVPKARDLACSGMKYHPGMAELFWMAAGCEMEMGSHGNAMLWAHHAIVLGRHKGIGDHIPRTSTLVLAAHYSGPFAILRDCYKMIGNEEMALRMQMEFLSALAKENELLTT